MSTQSNIRNKQLTIKVNKLIAEDTYEMTLTGDDFTCCNYGQFINLKISKGFLRRPISICDFNETELIITYKVVGCGTREISEYQVGSTIDTLYPLGTGFHEPEAGSDILIIGGGIGTPPLKGWENYLQTLGKYNIKTVCGFRNEEQIIYSNNFKDFTAVLDSNDENVLTHIQKNNIKFDYFYSCGPMGMLKALANEFEDGQLLLEERMGCGFGACMGCSVKTDEEAYKRVCVEGPMFYASEVRDA